VQIVKSEPSKEQIARFLECYDLLSRFHAEYTFNGGKSAFSMEDWPERPEQGVIDVRRWLVERAT
jgi:hypothetical protein